MKNKLSVLITGGAGFIGSKVVEELSLKQQFNLKIVDRRDIRKQHLPRLSKANIITGDLRNQELLDSALKGVDLVLHLAANIGSMKYMDDLQADILTDNLGIDAALYPSMIRAGVKTIIYSSSSMVFQNSRSYPYKEIDLLNISTPSNVYGFSKLAGEYFCRAFNKQYGLQYVIMRYHNIYGPGEKEKNHREKNFGNIHVIPALVQKVLSGQYPLEIITNSKDSSRSFTYIDDAVDATVRLVEEAASLNPKVINQDFNIGSSRSIKIIDLARLIWQICGDNRPFKYVLIPVESSTAVRREMDPGKIMTAVGWEAKVGLEQGIMKVVQSMKVKLP